MRDFRTDLNQHFGYLETEWGFSLESFTDQPRAFDNFLAVYSRSNVDIQIIRDRSQLFIAFRQDGGPWHEKDHLLEKLGVPRSRFPNYRIDDGYELWSGYDNGNQSNDLRTYLDLILQHLPSANGGGSMMFESAPVSPQMTPNPAVQGTCRIKPRQAPDLER